MTYIKFSTVCPLTIEKKKGRAFIYSSEPSCKSPAVSQAPASPHVNPAAIILPCCVYHTRPSARSLMLLSSQYWLWKQNLQTKAHLSYQNEMGEKSATFNITLQQLRSDSYSRDISMLFPQCLSCSNDNFSTTSRISEQQGQSPGLQMKTLTCLCFV